MWGKCCTGQRTSVGVGAYIFNLNFLKTQYYSLFIFISPIGSCALHIFFQRWIRWFLSSRNYLRGSKLVNNCNPNDKYYPQIPHLEGSTYSSESQTNGHILPFAYISISGACEVIWPLRNIYMVLLHLSHEENAGRFQYPPLMHLQKTAFSQVFSDLC